MGQCPSWAATDPCCSGRSVGMRVRRVRTINCLSHVASESEQYSQDRGGGRRAGHFHSFTRRRCSPYSSNFIASGPVWGLMRRTVVHHYQSILIVIIEPVKQEKTTERPIPYAATVSANPPQLEKPASAEIPRLPAGKISPRGKEHSWEYSQLKIPPFPSHPPSALPD